MFAKTIVDSDSFLDMPLSTQALYFHLSMRADDDGFINNPRKIQRMIGCSDDDLKVLVAKNFIIPFDSGVVVIKHWKIHNYIRGDRKKDTVYPEEMALLTVKDNGAYSLVGEEPILIENIAEENNEDETPRQKAYRESTLPYSFEYKIRQAFYGEPCPVCGCLMRASVDECGIASDIHKPSIQHNVPISKGGKHELGNISVICHKCNVTLQDTETDKLNADEVAEKWDEICMSGKCLSSDGQVTGKCRHRLGKDSIGEYSIVEDNINISPSATTKAKPTKHKYGEHNNVLLTDDEYAKLQDKLPYDYEKWIETLSEGIALKGYKYKSHYLAILKWARNEKTDAKPKEKSSNIFLDMLKDGD